MARLKLTNSSPNLSWCIPFSLVSFHATELSICNDADHHGDPVGAVHCLGGKLRPRQRRIADPVRNAAEKRVGALGGGIQENSYPRQGRPGRRLSQRTAGDRSLSLAGRPQDLLA